MEWTATQCSKRDMNNATFQNLPLFILMLRIFTMVIFKSCELGYVPLDEKMQNKTK